MNFQKLTNSQKGTIFFVIGLILLFYILNIFRPAMFYLVLLGSLFLLVYGFILADYWIKIKALFEVLFKKKPKLPHEK